VQSILIFVCRNSALRKITILILHVINNFGSLNKKRMAERSKHKGVKILITIASLAHSFLMIESASCTIFCENNVANYLDCNDSADRNLD
jgi:hypothetical protein